MKNIRINSELPLSMIGTQYDINEYEFVLFHLFKTNKTYHDYFMNLRVTDPSRLTILDNSAYEFFIKGETLNMEEYIEAICELKPQIYILPDVLMNMRKTVDGVIEFKQKYDSRIPEDCSGMAVLQGNSIREFLTCMNIYKKNNITHIAIPFHNSFLKELGMIAPAWIENIFKKSYKSITEDILYAMGRVDFVTTYKEKLSEFEYIHILGSHCPLEKKFYSDFNTMDTGYPVKLGLEGQELFTESKKPTTIIDDFLDKPIDDNIKKIILQNVKVFKHLTHFNHSCSLIYSNK